MGQGRGRFRPEKLADFFEAAYDLDADDEIWLANVLQSARAVWGRGGPAHGFIYDASDVRAFRMQTLNMIDFPDAGIPVFQAAVPLITPGYVARSFRSLLAHGSCRTFSAPELDPFFEGMGRLGTGDFMGINGLDPQGLGVLLAFWLAPPYVARDGEMAIYRRLAHHLGTAHRCRRRLRAVQPHRAKLDVVDGAEAILDARRRVVHAEGPAQEKRARAELVETVRARELALRATARAPEGLQQWPPLTSARWTLVDSFERGGARYVVARENQAPVDGLGSLTDRERQVVAYLAIGQSTKETAYALGISDVTVRILIRRASAKLGVHSRKALLAHREVRRLGATGGSEA
jgi:DNA-binding CsgD family transcriptional regulator